MTEIPALVSVTAVELRHDFVVGLWFDDGTEREVDLDEYLRGEVFAPLREDADLFAQVRVDHEAGTIVWPNGADMDPVVLHGSVEPAWKEDEAASKAG